MVVDRLDCRLDPDHHHAEDSLMKSLLEMLDPQGFSDQFDMMGKPDPVSIPDPPGRPDMADTIDMGNNAIEEINDSVLEAEYAGELRKMEYQLSLEQIKEGHRTAERR